MAEAGITPDAPLPSPTVPPLPLTGLHCTTCVGGRQYFLQTGSVADVMVAKRIAFAVMGYAGLRIGEVEQLRWEDLHMSRARSTPNLPLHA